MRILYVEDNPFDADLTRSELLRLAPELQLDVVDTLAAGEQRLAVPPLAYAAVLLDLRLPDGDGLVLLNHIRQRELPLVVVILTGQGDEEVALQALKLGASDYVVKSPGYLYRLPGVLENAVHMAELEREHKVLQDSYEKMIESWALALELRDHETRGQSLVVTELAVEMARAMGQTGEALAHMRRGALLHDVGKLGVPDAILQKKGPLTPEEWDVMKLHPTYGYQLLYPVELLRGAIDIPYCHHERWDGSGYPHGLKGEEIPLSARIFAVADVWEALNSDRPFRPAWDREHVIRFLREQAGIKFDAEVVEVLLKIV